MGAQSAGRCCWLAEERLHGSAGCCGTPRRGAPVLDGPARPRLAPPHPAPPGRHGGGAGRHQLRGPRPAHPHPLGRRRRGRLREQDRQARARAAACRQRCCSICCCAAHCRHASRAARGCAHMRPAAAATPRRRLLVSHEAPVTSGFGAEIVSTIADRCGWVGLAGAAGGGQLPCSACCRCLLPPPGCWRPHARAHAPAPARHAPPPPPPPPGASTRWRRRRRGCAATTLPSPWSTSRSTCPPRPAWPTPSAARCAPERRPRLAALPRKPRILGALALYHMPPLHFVCTCTHVPVSTSRRDGTAVSGTLRPSLTSHSLRISTAHRPSA